MKIKKFAASFLAGTLLGTLSMGSALAYEKCHKSKWGPNDQIGALNNITADNILAATKLIKKGKTMAMAIETNSKTPFSGSTGITTQAFGNTRSGGTRTSLSSCNPRVWTNLDQRASWIGFSISRSCAGIPNEFWLTGYTDADLGNDSTSIIDYDFSATDSWYVDISEADYLDSGDDMEEFEPQTITFYQSPSIALSKKVAYMNAFSDSGLDIEFTSSTPKVCVPLNWSSVIRLINAGTCKITANQGGDESYDVADPVSMSFKVTKVAVKSKVVAKPVPVPAPTKKAPGSIGGKTKN